MTPLERLNAPQMRKDRQQERRALWPLFAALVVLWIIASIAAAELIGGFTNHVAHKNAVMLSDTTVRH